MALPSPSPATAFSGSVRMPITQPSAQPNVLLIVSDDHGYADRGALGLDPRVRTPALDRLAREGVTCTDAYMSAPICSPSRAGLIAGRYQQRWGATWFDSSRFPDEVPSLAERFRALGYATGYFGKVHYGPERPGDRTCPPNHGFDESLYGLAGQSMGRLHYLHHSRASARRYGPDASWRMGVRPLWAGDREAEHEGSLTAELGGRARDFVSHHADGPFFCMVAFNAVHNFCWQLPAEELRRRGLAGVSDWDPDVSAYVDWYDGAIWPHLPDGRGYYLAQLELMDAEVGLLLDELDRLGVADDTLVVYTTDNGGSTCNFGDNGPLAGTKYTLWEGGIRVPFLARWRGGGLAAGARREGVVSALDLYPTLLSAAGAGPDAWAECDGVDQLPLLRGERAAGHATLHWDCGFQRAVRSGRWKLLDVDSDDPHAEAIRRTEHADPGQGVSLYDLDADPGESHDLAAAHPDVVRGLTSLHETWRRDIGMR
ncbi:MAG: sulfatase family protein [Streptosporangiaceae bacterium]